MRASMDSCPAARSASARAFILRSCRSSFSLSRVGGLGASAILLRYVGREG
jgi:hypothetical protein